MSHSLASTPSSHSSDGTKPYSFLGQGELDKEFCERNVRASTETARDVSPGGLGVSSKMVRRLLVDCVSILVSIVVYIFAILGYRAGGKVIGAEEKYLLNVARIVATAYPYIFALILGRTLQNTLCWRLERGVDCLSFAYLSRSLTLGSACIAPFQIRCRHWLPAFLLVFWTFSPLGSQAFLRFISPQRGAVSEQLQRPVQYIYPKAPWTPTRKGDQSAARDSMFLATFHSIGNTAQQSRDVWGNLKTPLLNHSGDTSDPTGWRQLPPSAEVPYTALCGIPFLIPQDSGNLTFLMQSWYWQLENATLRDSTSPGALLATSEFNGSSILQNFTGKNHLWQFGIPKELDPLAVTSIPLTFEVQTSGIPSSEIPPKIENFFYPLENELNISYHYASGDPYRSAVRVEAVLIQRPVEMNVTCTGLACNVTAIRQVATDATLNLAGNMNYAVKYFFRSLKDAFPRDYAGEEEYGAFEAYLYDPTRNPYSVRDAIDITNIGADTLAIRLTQVLNTYWIVDNFFDHVPGSFNASDSNLLSGGAIRIGVITATRAQDIIYCDHVWLAMLCISTLLMLVAATASIVLNLLRLAPDSIDFLSALSLNGGKTILEDQSFLDADERIRLLKDFRLKIGDGQSGNDIGRIIIGVDGEVGHLHKGRLYQ